MHQGELARLRAEMAQHRNPADTAGAAALVAGEQRPDSPEHDTQHDAIEMSCLEGIRATFRRHTEPAREPLNPPNGNGVHQVYGAIIPSDNGEAAEQAPNCWQHKSYNQKAAIIDAVGIVAAMAAIIFSVPLFAQLCQHSVSNCILDYGIEGQCPDSARASATELVCSGFIDDTWNSTEFSNVTRCYSPEVEVIRGCFSSHADVQLGLILYSTIAILYLLADCTYRLSANKSLDTKFKEDIEQDGGSTKVRYSLYLGALGLPLAIVGAAHHEYAPLFIGAAICLGSMVTGVVMSQDCCHRRAANVGLAA